MATAKNIISHINGTTHLAVIAGYMDGIRAKICRMLCITSGDYEMMHYELAYMWFEKKGYLEYTARRFLLSKIFHAWWNQQVALEEQKFIIKFRELEYKPDVLRTILETRIKSLDLYPSRELLRLMHAEGTEAIRVNPDLAKLKIYRHA